jgi:very-short-patch-repair endonuclease/signal recognition particle GTPase
MELDQELSSKMDKKIQHWVKKLLDFSGRNRLIFFKPTKTATIQIIHPSINKIYKSIIENGNSLTFPIDEEDELPLFDEKAFQFEKKPHRNLKESEIGTDHSAKELSRKLYNLSSRSKMAKEEQGVNILYLALGFLNWKETQKSEVIRSPIILIPAELFRDAPGKPYQVSMFEDDLVINPTLQELLFQEYGIMLEDIDNDSSYIDIERYLAEVTEKYFNDQCWKVDMEIILDIFSYQKQLLVADIKKNTEYLKHNNLITSISTKLPLKYESNDFIEAKELDDKTKPTDVFQILDADSSQQEAIEAAKAGLSFVLQGPPGTGKSQTIANIIAEFLANGKHVLFVSAKMAALEVVQKRLIKVGLGDFCLQIHSHKRNKKEVIQEFGNSLDLSSEETPNEVNEILENCLKIRMKLNNYVRALHKPNFKLGLSAFQSYGLLSKLSDIPNLPFSFSRIEFISKPELNEIENTIIEIASFRSIIKDYYSHPWFGFSGSINNIDEKNKIEKEIINLRNQICELIEESKYLVEEYNTRLPLSIKEIRDLYHFSLVFLPIAIDTPLEEMLERYNSKYIGFTRFFMKQYWLDQKTLSNLRKARKQNEEEDPIKQIEYIINFQNFMKRNSPKSEAEANIQMTDLSKFENLTKSIQYSFRTFIEYYEPKNVPMVLSKYNIIECKAIISWLDNQYAQMNYLLEWMNFQKLYEKANREGIGNFIELALEGSLDPEKWLTIFLKRFYFIWNETIVLQDSVLSTFNSEIFNRYVEEFKRLDKLQIKYSRLRIRERLLIDRPKANWMVSPTTEEAILRRELNKSRRIKPLRRLFKEIPDLIMKLKPCFMMGPLSVSQLLDPNLYSFDLVIFDEASQIHPEEAVGAIFRGKQVIIVGDKNQLPPTSFFEVIDSDDIESNENGDEIEDLESILDEGDAAGLSSKMLRWHYRSRDESLIAFSNHNIYRDRLLTFPSPFSEKNDTGVSFVFVPNGVYRRRSRFNEVEATAVVDLIIDHYEKHPHLSLGVVTFSQTQKETIEMILTQRLKNYPSIINHFYDNDHEEPYFIKSLEFVQGDERDVILFSIGYGKDEVGKFLMNFGPLNKEGGERRLNVAVTRARQKVILVSSIQPEDMDLSNTNSKGVRLLRNYMEMARDGIKALYKDIEIDNDAEVESPFEEAVYDVLIEKGLIIKKQVGVSGYRIDMAIVDDEHPGNFLLGIECDGAMYHSGLTARDRDRLRQEILENLGWKIYRIWSRDWYRDQKHEVAKLLRAIEDCKKKAPINDQTTISSNFNELNNQVRNEKAIHFPKGIVYYRPATLPKQLGGSEGFHKFTAYSTFAKLIYSIVEAEGPIQIDLLVRRLVDAWGIRAGQQITHTIRSIVNSEVEMKHLVYDEDSISISGNPIYIRIPQNKNIRREIDHISLKELKEAVIICVQSAVSLTEEDLIKEVACLYKLRVSSNAYYRIRNVIEDTCKSGKVIERNRRIYIRK